MAPQINDRPATIRLLVCLIVCPLILALTIATIADNPRYYRTGIESLAYLVMLASPWVGVFGIVRYARLGTLGKWVASVAYLLLTYAAVGGTALFVGCSLAGACL
jgi:hypothetical protein